MIAMYSSQIRRKKLQAASSPALIPMHQAALAIDAVDLLFDAGRQEFM